MTRPPPAAWRLSESDTDSLGFGEESDGQDTDLQEYGKNLGLDPEDADWGWLVHEAFSAPLPLSWSEHADAEGRVYYFNQATEESTWTHPMDRVYRELLAVARAVIKEGSEATLERRARAVREHLLEAHKNAIEHLVGWSGPYPLDSGQYYYNNLTGTSSWVNPIEACEYELAVRHSVLHRCLLVGFEAFEEETTQGSPAHELPAALQLPLSLARREDDDTNSARSFYTARDSAHSNASARSVSGLNGTPRPLRVSLSKDPEAEAPRPRLDLGALEPELEVTFGCSERLRIALAS